MGEGATVTGAAVAGAGTGGAVVAGTDVVRVPPPQAKAARASPVNDAMAVNHDRLFMH